MEATSHATRIYREKYLPTGKILVKMDFRNAFSSLRRDVLLLAAHSALPEWYPLSILLTQIHHFFSGAHP